MPHSGTQVLIFDDGRALLSPMTDLRAVFDIRTGALTTLDRFHLASRQSDGPTIDGLLVPTPLEALTRERHPRLPVNGPLPSTGSVLLVNGGCPLATVDTAGVELGTCVLGPEGVIIKAHVTPDRVTQVLAGDTTGFPIMPSPAASEPLSRITRPWHVRTLRDRCIARDLELLFAKSVPAGSASASAASARLFVDPSAIVHPSVIFDTQTGPIYIDQHAVIRPGAILVGPAYVGPNTTLLERTLVKSNTAIGPWCKVAGEIGGVIFQGFANKSHDGHLGDAWIGEWVNLGAGTTNSNLLNTYADVICRALPSPDEPAQPAPGHERTGEQFLGCVLGDHVKAAICTRIMTGAIVGTGTMFAASTFLSGTVSPFSWITDAGAKPYRFDKFMEVAEAAMARRKVIPSAAYRERLAQFSMLATRSRA